MAGSPVKRSFAGASLDYLGARYVGAGPETCSYTTQAIQIPLRDGVELAADLYEPELPDGKAPTGLILIQCCYGRGAGISFLYARVFAARGFQALFVSTRGTHGSGGTFDPGNHEQSDSQDIVAWMRQQPWYHGSFATLGPSYLGYSQWALLHDPPSDCVAAVIAVGPHDQGWHAWGTGSFRLDRASWSDMMSKKEDEKGSFLSLLARLPGLSFLRSPELDHAVAGLPLEDSLKKHFGDRAPWLFEYLQRPNVQDVYWTSRRHPVALERVNIPILLIGGWYDTFTMQTMHQFKRLHDRGVDVSLIVGPWTHTQGSGIHSTPDILDFLSEHLAKNGKYKNQPARIFVTGSEEWRSMPTWPPSTQPETLYLQEGNCLGSKKPVQGVSPGTFTFDPLDPTPSIGGNQMSAGGRVDDSAYADRSDVLVFTSEPLSEDLEILGIPAVHLIHASDSPFVDLFLRISEVDDRGVSHNITELYKALDPSRDTSQPLVLDLQDCAHRFRVGTRVRLIIAGGSFPMYARSLGTAEDRLRSDKTVPQKHTVTIAGGVSQLILPVNAAV
ncbi:hydrolase [Penicillium brasilianum]|uniref:Hydrolase n=1 Tax=Penicillium brasilianum TaxID=104259 RepID=A0A1S9RXP4_PENBI|nr:hydrolase [Penicillium brasilianum]